METGTDHFFGGGGGTEITLPALGFTILAALLILVLPRKYAFVPCSSPVRLFRSMTNSSLPVFI